MTDNDTYDQLERYCHKCGQRLQAKNKIIAYHHETGQMMHRAVFTCPSRRWWIPWLHSAVAYSEFEPGRWHVRDF